MLFFINKWKHCNKLLEKCVKIRRNRLKRKTRSKFKCAPTLTSALGGRPLRVPLNLSGLVFLDITFIIAIYSFSRVFVVNDTLQKNENLGDWWGREQTYHHHKYGYPFGAFEEAILLAIQPPSMINASYFVFLKVKSLWFFFKGELVEDDDTPFSLQMADGDVVECFTISD